MAAPPPVEASWLYGLREEGVHQHPQMNVHHQFEESHVANSSSKPTSNANTSTQKKKRTQPDPDSEVIALSPKTLTTTSRFICDVCNKGFQREQNLQLHRRGHSLPWKLKLKSNSNEVRKKVYVCPEPTCVHHNPSRALGDLTGIKKHFFRKHCEKKWECEKCSKRYAVQSDWKAHSKTCGTKEYRCDCGTLFSRRDSFMTHQAFCNAIAQGSLVNPTNLSALKGQVLGHINMVNGNDFASLMPSAFHPTSSVSLGCSPSSNYRDQEDQNKLAFDGMLQQHRAPSEHKDHHTFFYSTAREDYSESPTNEDYYINSKISNGISSSNLFANHHLEGTGGSFSAGLYVSENMMSDHISQSLYTSTVSLQNSNSASSLAHLSATALLQKAAQVGSSHSNINTGSTSLLSTLGSSMKYDHDGASLGTSATCFGTLQNINNHVHDGWMSSHGGVGSILPSCGEYTTNEVLVPTGGSAGVCDRLTRDFLGVGLIVQHMSNGVSQNDHLFQNHHGHQMSPGRGVLGRNSDFSSLS